MRRSPRTSLLLPPLGISLAALLAVSCGPGMVEPEPDELAELKRGMLASVGERVILPTLRTFDERLASLEQATAALAADPTPDNRAAAQAAWAQAMDTWEQAEMMQLGPLGMSGVNGVIGGESRRDEVYSWPATSSCGIDQETAGDGHADADTLAVALVNVRGLDALEYLLFVDTGENTCSSLSPINADGTWAALGEAQVAARRAVYAHTVATLLVRESTALRGSWEADGFAAELAAAGDTSELFGTAQSALDEVAGALLYIDNQSRDMKLGEPAGLTEGCPTETCPEALEARFSRTSLAQLRSNLRGFELMFHGGEPGDEAAIGFDDLLVEVGQETLAADIAASIAASFAALDAIADPLEDAITTMAALVAAAYDALGETQRLFKVDVVTVLDLDTSSRGPADDD